jgi:predicted alpha/beta-fold hydrolase
VLEYRLMIPFEPLFRNPHLQTIAGHLWRRHGEEARFPLEPRLYRTEPEVEVLVQSQHPGRRTAGEIVMVHGLEGSGEAGYVRSLSGAALRAGYAAHRFHMRTCGGTERLAPTLYHAGLTGDLLFVLREFAREGRGPVFLVGFSLGGNVVLKLAGELADTGSSLIAGVCAVCAPLDLAACARRIADRENRFYERRFVGRMHARLRATGRFGKGELAGLCSVIEIDDRITAPSFGFGTAAHYYETQSAMRYLGSIRIPALLIHAHDDTLVPFSSVVPEAARANPCLELQVCAHGGHLGFIGRRPHRFWADHAILEWIGRQGGAAA